MSELYQRGVAIVCLMKTGPRQDSPRASRTDLACELCLAVWLSFGKQRIDAARKKILPTGTATDMITDSAALVAMEMCSICSVT